VYWTEACVESEQIVERLKGVTAEGIYLLLFRLRFRHFGFPFTKSGKRWLMPLAPRVLPCVLLSTGE